MKTTTKSRLLLIGGVILQCAIYNPQSASAQCQPMVIIDGNYTVVDDVSPTSLKLPSWLKANQVLNIGQYVYSISVIEFSVNGSALDYSQNLSVTAASTVPSNRVWKIEAVNKNSTLPSFSGTYIYSTAGTYTFVAPPCISTARVQMWGGGGAGGGGGGGGYAEGFYQLNASGSYTITVGAGGTAGSWGAAGGVGGTSSVNIISISAAGGGSGPATTPCCGTGGAGSGQLNFTGQAGPAYSGNGGKGGDGANSGGGGGAGGVSSATGTVGAAPGGGGGGSWGGTGAAGGAGRVIITFGASASTSTTTTINPSSGTLQFNQAISIYQAGAGCIYTVPSGKVFELKTVSSNGAGWINLGSSSCSSTERGYFYLQGGSVQGYVTGGAGSVPWQMFPQWLPAGTIIYFGGTGNNLNGIEWTVVP